jgi:threonine dehydrogenase-like Zn-dependent dehydrogenase
MGADVVVDPAERSPYESWSQVAAWEDPSQAPPQLPWVAGPPLRPGVIFECVGVPGVIHQILAGAPPGARVVVAGVCMERDHFEPMLAINKELNLQFVLAYTPDEFARTLRHIAEGDIPVEQLVTGVVGIEGVPEAFDELANPERHAKIVVEPWGR